MLTHMHHSTSAKCSGGTMHPGGQLVLGKFDASDRVLVPLLCTVL